jgi:hypothetical protein
MVVMYFIVVLFSHQVHKGHFYEVKLLKSCVVKTVVRLNGLTNYAAIFFAAHNPALVPDRIF